MKYDLNCNVKVQLTSYGLDLLHEYFDDFDDIELDAIKNMEVGNYHRMKLYQLFDVFGDYVFPSKHGVGPFVDNAIEMED